jgi:hypothetical protein
LSVAAAFKFTSADLAIKDVNLTTTVSFTNLGKVLRSLSNTTKPGDTDPTDQGVMPFPEFSERYGVNLRLLVVKVAAGVDANKGIQPIRIWNAQFNGYDPNLQTFSIQKDTDTAAFWLGDLEAISFGISDEPMPKPPPPPSPPPTPPKWDPPALFYYFNPNDGAVVDIFYGYDPAPPAQTQQKDGHQGQTQQQQQGGQQAQVAQHSQGGPQAGRGHA